jgi:hypothetical protein
LAFLTNFEVVLAIGTDVMIPLFDVRHWFSVGSALVQAVQTHCFSIHIGGYMHCISVTLWSVVLHREITARRHGTKNIRLFSSLIIHEYLQVQCELRSMTQIGPLPFPCYPDLDPHLAPPHIINSDPGPAFTI